MGAMVYACALNFKQTTLYFAPAFAFTLLMLCIRVRSLYQCGEHNVWR